MQKSSHSQAVLSELSSEQQQRELPKGYSSCLTPSEPEASASAQDAAMDFGFLVFDAVFLTDTSTFDLGETWRSH